MSFARPFAGVRAPLDDADSLQVVDELGHRREGHARLRGELGETRPLGFDVGGHVRVRYACVLQAGGEEPIEQLGLEQACELGQQLADVEAMSRGD